MHVQAREKSVSPLQLHTLKSIETPLEKKLRNGTTYLLIFAPPLPLRDPGVQ